MLTMLEEMNRVRRLFITVFGALCLLLCSSVASQVVAEDVLKLVPIKSSSTVKLIYGKKSVVFDLEEEVPAILPGDEPHHYKVLLTAKKDKTLYLLARVCSHSPISDPYAPCGGDEPCALLWVKTDESLQQREIKSAYYASCSVNYYPLGQISIVRGKLTVVYREGVNFGDKVELTYDNSEPDKGIVLKKLG